MNNISNEIIYLHHLRTHPEFQEMVSSEYFENKMIKKIFKAVKGFYNKFHDIPTWEQIRVLIVGKKSPEFYDENENFKIEEFRTIIDHDVNLYDSEWIDTQFTTWLKFKSLDDSILSSIQLLKSTNVDSSNIDILVSKIVETIQNKNNISLDLNLGSDFSDIEKHITLVSNRKKTGIDFFDKCLAGGVGPGELVIFAGAPKSGKSTFMTNFACKSMLQGQNTVIVSFEMNEPTYIKRCACNLFNMTSAEYDTIVAEEDKYSLKSVMKQLYKKDEDFLKFPGQLIIKAFPTSSASVRDVEAYLKKLQDVKNMKIDLVVLDYVNIMENYRNKNSENTYIKVKQICEDVRGMCHRLQVGVISGTQLNQEGRVGESYGLKSTCDGLFKILSRDMIDIKNGTVKVEAELLRNAEMPNEKLVCDIDFSRMQIKEKTTIPIDYADPQNNNSKFKKSERIYASTGEIITAGEASQMNEDFLNSMM